MNDKLVIDWELGVRLAGNKRDVAEELLSLFVKELPHELAEIKKFRESNNHKELLKHLHKLHGAACYCGVPRLKYATAELEKTLKQNKPTEIADLFMQFEVEANNVLKKTKEL